MCGRLDIILRISCRLSSHLVLYETYFENTAVHLKFARIRWIKHHAKLP